MLNWENVGEKSFQDEVVKVNEERRTLKVGLLLAEDSLSWEGVWDERESDKEN